MSGLSELAFDVQAPRLNQTDQTYIMVEDVTTSSSTPKDLSASANFNELAQSCFLTFQADGGDVYFAFNNANSGSIDETATSGATRCWKIPDGTSIDRKLSDGFTWLITKGSAACKLRIQVSSKVR